MSEEKEDKKEKAKTITLTLKRIAGIVKDPATGKITNQVDPGTKTVVCVQDDTFGIQQLLYKFDSRLHTVREWKFKSNVIDKTIEIYRKMDEKKTEEYQLELTLDEAAFLKAYLNDFQEKEGKQGQLKEFEQRTLVDILDQLS